MKRINRILLGIGIPAMLMLSACNGASVSQFFNRTKPTASVPNDLPPRVQSQLRDFDFAAQSLKALYVKNDAVGQTWQKTVDDERKKIIDAKDVDGNQFLGSLNAIVEALNDTSAGLSLPATPQPTGTQQPRFAGIGILAGLPEEGKDRILVLTVYPDSPADRAGLKAHDAITAIEGDAVTFEDRNTLIPKLRGEEETDVIVTVRTPGEAPREVTITRKIITPVSALISRRLEGTNIGYIAPNPSTASGMRSDVVAALRELNADQNIDGLVFDLRIIRANDFPLTDMLSLFANGQVASVQTRAKKEKLEVSGKSIGGSQEVPMVVLVSDQTVGQAEAFSGILQDLGRAQIIGTQTKGDMAQVTTMTLPSSRIQMLIPTGDYVGIKNTIWRGKESKNMGIKPNIVSDKTWEEFTTDDDPQLKQAEDVLMGK